ncbi:dTDP-4-amino-4,6-dideoxygalactose transaminase [Vibrio genomosp. F6]|uniref:dTDP-4-amino-4,6-dideoxygalactose transaminase n=1 Tax=Vibrio genomosp. F6 str. FF-238 TaxID=1191298 RepID=A0A1E5D2G1_9VIBR|nr:dTDP-4-amino-4,6-dideoxygalactose transaminase [Vibrio genomosp. F6]OEE77716.1 dTDP-4-amino-4,6-dideoxygalactose transaminase [Vibrio genomosp. F6 str. FF-238]
MIPFNKPAVLGSEINYISNVINSGNLCGDNQYSKLCEKWFEEKFNCKFSLLTPSCTAALEMAAILIDIKPGDEVIMPSYTFVSTANAFALRGAKIVFVDIRPDTMNIDENLIEDAVTKQTKAIVPVHYAGVACEMDTIMAIAAKHNLYVIEDAAQGVMSEYKGQALGTIGHLGAFSFHETKNYTSGGEGGLLIVNEDKFTKRAEIIREKGTNRKQFFRGMIDKYSWVDIGSSYLPSDIQGAYLWAQLANAVAINNDRLRTWEFYYKGLYSIFLEGHIDLPVIPDNCKHNAHMFYIKINNIDTRSRLIEYLKMNNISSAFHYIPLHSSLAGEHLGRFFGDDEHTTVESERILRLPMYYGLTEEQQLSVISALQSFDYDT